MRQNWVEWLALGVSLIAITALVGLLAWSGISDAGRPPQPVVTLGESYTSGSGWIQAATVENRGDEPAEQVLFEAAAQVGGTLETSRVQLDFLPAGSQERIFFGFSGSPSGSVEVRVVGFRAP